MIQLFCGDCLAIMPTLAANSVDAIICDPPYMIDFMGKAFDTSKDNIAGRVEVWREALRVAKPGAMLLAFGATRTHHRLMVAIEDAGWEIRDVCMFLHGMGFPKGHSQLKPAWEPIIMARKPLIGTVAANVLAWGTGGLNVDACRIPTSADDAKAMERVNSPGSGRNYGYTARQTETGKWDGPIGTGLMDTTKGRWPANLILDEEAAALLDEQSGERKGDSPGRMPRNNIVPIGDKGIYGHFSPIATGGHSDTGGASRFFYTAKASKRDRDEGLEGMEEQSGALRENGRFHSGGRTQVDGQWIETGSEPLPKRNVHPTVKPTSLMRWLVRLVTPQGGTILDPFTGSGSTGKAAMLENKSFIGIEIDAEYLAIAERRIAAAQQQLPLLEVP